jgi:hypothetical protein
VSVLDLPTARLPWASIAKILQGKRLANDYSRRWPVIVRNAKLRQAQSGGAGGSTFNVPAAHGRLPVDAASLNARRLQLLNKLMEG